MFVIDTLKNKLGDILYPKTRTDAVYDADGNRLDNIITDIQADIVNNPTEHTYSTLNTVNKTIVGAINETRLVQVGTVLQTPLGNIRFVRYGTLVHVYGSLSNMTSTQTTVVLGTTEFPSTTDNIALPCYSKTLPYGAMNNASVWITSSGSVTLYKASGVTGAYIAGMYMCK